MRWDRAGGWMILGWLALSCAGCKPHAPAPGAHDAAFDASASAAAEAAIRADLPRNGDARFRGVQVYAQALPGRWAVCGQVSPYANDPALFVPFVAVMTEAHGTWSGAADSRFIGSSVSDADRTYLAMVVHCYDEGGPSDGPVQSVPPAPPVPNQIPRPAEPAAAAPAPAQPGAAATASGTVTLRQNANLHATPQGPSVRVVPQGTALRVFGTAPGGWFQVGDEAPWGWVHGSMLDGTQH